MDVKIDVEGARRLARHLNKIDKEFNSRLRTEVYLPLAKELEPKVKAETPVGPGRPARKGRGRRPRRGQSLWEWAEAGPSRRARAGGTLRKTVRAAATRSRAQIRAGGKRAPYANAIHWGWPKRNIPRNPWMWRVVGRERPRMFKKFYEALNKYIKDWNSR